MNNSLPITYLISDFNVRGLARALYCHGGEAISVEMAPFGQVFPALLDKGKWENSVRVIWTSPEAVVPEFRAALEMMQPDERRCLAEVDEYAAAIAKNSRDFKATLVASWTVPAFYRGYGMLDFRACGLRRLLLKMSLRLAEQLETACSTYMLDSSTWIQAAGRNAWNPKLWYLNKTPFVSEVFSEAAQDIAHAMTVISGGARKLVVVDLDGTLWNGVIGDLGWENIVLGQHHHHGEAFLDFQRVLKSLTRRGILLGIASKNDEQVVVEAFTKHPDMVLRLDDFAGWRINWNDKAGNIVDLASALNVGLQSVVFIDDNPVERARVRQALPDVFVPDWPEDKTRFASELLRLKCFDMPQITDEDRSRTRLYAEQRARRSKVPSFTSVDEWLHSLETVVTIEPLNHTNGPRSVQLLNKTNQMNLRTRRMTENELFQWLKDDRRRFWTVRVKDRIGDSGLVGLVSLEIQGTRAHIVDFVLSCRVMGRKIEHAMVAAVAQHCREQGLLSLHAHFHPTDRNKPCFEFWKGSGFNFGPDSTFTWCLSQVYPFPFGMTVILPDQLCSSAASAVSVGAARPSADDVSISCR